MGLGCQIFSERYDYDFPTFQKYPFNWSPTHSTGPKILIMPFEVAKSPIRTWDVIYLREVWPIWCLTNTCFRRNKMAQPARKYLGNDLKESKRIFYFDKFQGVYHPFPFDHFSLYIFTQSSLHRSLSSKVRVEWKSTKKWSAQKYLQSKLRHSAPSKTWFCETP